MLPCVPHGVMERAQKLPPIVKTITWRDPKCHRASGRACSAPTRATGGDHFLPSTTGRLPPASVSHRPDTRAACPVVAPRYIHEPGGAGCLLPELQHGDSPRPQGAVVLLLNVLCVSPRQHVALSEVSRA